MLNGFAGPPQGTGETCRHQAGCGKVIFEVGESLRRREKDRMGKKKIPSKEIKTEKGQRSQIL